MSEAAALMTLDTSSPRTGEDKDCSIVHARRDRLLARICGRALRYWKEKLNVDGVRGLGRAIIAAVLLMIGGVLNIIYGIAAISNSKVFATHATYAFGHLKTWGWITLIIGVLELIASASLFAGGAFGRWFGVFVGSLAAIGALLAIPAYPLLAIAIFALSLWIIHGLIIYSAPEDLSLAAPPDYPSSSVAASAGPRPPT